MRPRSGVLRGRNRLAGLLASLFFLLPAFGAAQDARFFDDAYLERKYAVAPSKFVTVEGVRFHVRDEGKGPVLLLLNGHLGSLHMWDAWVRILSPQLRIVRIDYAPYGLSGPDPSGDYSTEHAVRLVHALVQRLRLEKFSIGGTSNGALVALFYAIEHPERVDRVVVSTLPAGRPPPRKPSDAMRAAAVEVKAQAPFQPRAFWDAFLHDIMANDAVIDDALVDRYFELNNRRGAKAWVDAYIDTQYHLWDTLDVKEKFSRLRRPILLQWGADGVVLPEQIGHDVAGLLRAAPVTLKQYRNAGHLPMLEQPEATARDALAFLRGTPLVAD